MNPNAQRLKTQRHNFDNKQIDLLNTIYKQSTSFLEIWLKAKKPFRNESEKLFIGLTTKP